MKKIILLIFFILIFNSFCSAQFNYKKQFLQSDFDKHITSDTNKWDYYDSIGVSTGIIADMLMTYTTDSFKMVFGSTDNAIGVTIPASVSTYTWTLDRDVIIIGCEIFSQDRLAGNISIAISTGYYNTITVSTGSDLVGGTSMYSMLTAWVGSKTLKTGTTINVFVRGISVTVQTVLFKLNHWWKIL